MTLQEQLNKTHSEIAKSIPAESDMFDADALEMERLGIHKHSVKEGDKIPAFTLNDHLNNSVSSIELLSKGPLVISFYRGGWCPYCNLELQALKQHLPQIKNLGASLIAISPQTPDESLSTAEKHELPYPVLSDIGQKVSRQFGLVFELSKHLRPAYTQFGIDLPKINGSNTFELPVPGTFITDSNGIIVKAFVNADYKQRMEPSAIIETLKHIRSH